MHVCLNVRMHVCRCKHRAHAPKKRKTYACGNQQRLLHDQNGTSTFMLHRLQSKNMGTPETFRYILYKDIDPVGHAHAYCRSLEICECSDVSIFQA